MPAPAIKNYLSLVKFSHTVFALPFAAIGFTLGIIHTNFTVDYQMAVKVLMCMIFARTAAMAFNRWADATIDAKNPRTAVREVPSGVISAKSALIFTILNCLLFITTTWFINPLCFYLSFVALAVILSYSYTKRFTPLCHLILGVGLSLAPIGSYLAVTGEFNMLPLWFSFAVLCWVSGFDIIYSLQDEPFDKANNLHSIPVLFGGKKALSISTNLHLAAAVFLLAAGLEGDFGWIYFTGWLLFSLLLIYQHKLVKPDDLSRVNIAFFTTNGIASLLFAIFTITDLLV
jgi:4-hydroxybenzoate polyprenyltransferase